MANENLPKFVFDEMAMQNIKDKIDLTKISEYMEQAQNLVPLITQMFPMIKNWEKEFKPKANQRILHTSMFLDDDAFFVGYVIERFPDNSSRIVKEIYKHSFSELIKKLPSFLQPVKDKYTNNIKQIS